MPQRREPPDVFTNLWVEAIGYGFCTILLCAFCLFLLRAERRARAASEMRPYWTILGLIATADGCGMAYGVWRQHVPPWPLALLLGIAGACAVPLLLSAIVRVGKRIERQRGSWARETRIAEAPAREERVVAFTAFVMPATAQVLCALMLFVGALGWVLTWAIEPLRAYVPLLVGMAVLGALGCGVAFLRVAYRIRIRREGLHVEWRAGLFPTRRFSCLWSDVTKVRMGIDAKQATFQMRSRRGWLDCQGASTQEAERWYAELESAALEALGCTWREGYVLFRSGGRMRGYRNDRRRGRVRVDRRAPVITQ